MSRQDDLKEIRELTIKLNQWCYEYYVLSKPTVSNDVFDQNFDRLKFIYKADKYNAKQQEH